MDAEKGNQKANDGRMTPQIADALRAFVDKAAPAQEDLVVAVNETKKQPEPVSALGRDDPRQGKQPLIEAAEAYPPKTREFRELLKDGFWNVNAQDNDGKTALMAVADNASMGREYRKFAEMLIRHGAIVDMRDNLGQTALMYASWRDNVGMAKMLIQSGADVNLADNEGETALMHAANRDIEIAKMLIRSGAIVDTKDKKGQTALMWASGKEQTEIVEMLLKSGADESLRDIFGYTAATYSNKSIREIPL